MRKNRRTAVLILAVSTILSCSGCGSIVLEKEHLPEETIEAYEDAINDMDVQAMMDCIDEDSLKALTGGMDLALKIAGKLTDFDLGLNTEQLLNLMPLAKAVIGEDMDAVGYPEVDFQVTETYIKGDKATVWFTENKSSENSVINMKKTDGKWYMTLDTHLIKADEAERVIIAGQEETQDTETGDGASGELQRTESVLDDISLSDLLLNEGKLKEFIRGWLE